MKCPECGTIMNYDINTGEWVCPKCGHIEEGDYIPNEPKNEQYNISKEKTTLIESIPKNIFDKLSNFTKINLSNKNTIDRNYADALFFAKNILKSNRVDAGFIAEFENKFKRYYYDKSFFKVKRRETYFYFSLAYLYIFAKLHYIPLSKFYLTKYLLDVFNYNNQIDRFYLYQKLDEYINKFINHFKIDTKNVSNITLTQSYLNKYLDILNLNNNNDLINKLAQFNLENSNKYSKILIKYDPAQIAEFILYKFAEKEKINLDLNPLFDWTMMDLNILENIEKTIE